MNMNPMMLMQIKGMLDDFKRNHPKVPMFFSAAAQSIGEGSIIEITVTINAITKIIFRLNYCLYMFIQGARCGQRLFGTRQTEK